MSGKKWNVLIFCPTNLFHQFISRTLISPHAHKYQVHNLNQAPVETISATQLANYLQTDNTACLIHKKESDEKLISFIYSHYRTLYKHELSRWFPKRALERYTFNPLDFFDFFKFKLHSNILCMEESPEHSRQLISISSTEKLLNWFKDLFTPQDTELTNLAALMNVDNLSENATVILKNFRNYNLTESFLNNAYQDIFKAEMSRICPDHSRWPSIQSYEEFTDFFSIKLHTQLFHLI